MMVVQKARVMVYQGPLNLEARELPLPEIGPEELLLEVLLCGVDGTEVHAFRGEIGWANEAAPLIFGDEVVGRVAVIGEVAKDRRGLDVGDRVVLDARWPCNRCRPCIQGQYFACEEATAARTGYGVMNVDRPPGLWGGYASHVYVPPGALLEKVPDGMDSKTALMACSVLANGIRWTSFGNIGLGTRVAVIGPGPQGLGTVLAAAHRGAKVVSIGLEEDAARLEVAKRLGAVQTIAIARDESTETTRERVLAGMGPIDVAIDVAGFVPAKQLALSLPRTMGVVLVPAVSTPPIQSVDFMSLLRREVALLSPRSHPHSIRPALELAAQMVGEGIDVGDFVSHIFPLEAAEEALRVAGGETGERPIKTALDPTMTAGVS
jgi:threonine dehydrogenase-like Zn-dependent dehydrogenase